MKNSSYQILSDLLKTKVHITKQEYQYLDTKEGSRLRRCYRKHYVPAIYPLQDYVIMYTVYIRGTIDRI